MKKSNKLKVLAATDEMVVINIPSKPSYLREAPRLLKVYEDHIEIDVDMPIFEIDESEENDPGLAFTAKKKLKRTRKFYFDDMLLMNRTIHAITHGSRLTLFFEGNKRHNPPGIGSKSSKYVPLK